MLLSKLIERLDDAQVISDDIDITDIVIDSRKAKEGCLFVCIPGNRIDRHAFAPQAVDQGATALLVEHIVEGVDAVQIVTKDSRKAFAIISAAFYGYPYENIDIVGVTGTNGKTTTTWLIRGVMSHLSIKTGVIGTVASFVGSDILPQSLTTPDPMELQSILRQMVDNDCKLAIMEVSAHALELRKIAGMQFKSGIFTNLTQDHLDDFGTMENYARAKQKFFDDDVLGCAIINVDDSNHEYMIENFSKKVVTYGIKNPADLKAENIDIKVDSINFDLHYKDEIVPIFSSLTGIFNVYNILATAAACMEYGLSLRSIAAGLSNIILIDGRMERVAIDAQFSVIVDYAHTPDSLENCITALKGTTQGRVISVFGCGGDRDPIKRSIMGGISGRLADFTVVTSDNPRTERPGKIIKQIEGGIKEVTKEYKCVTNRRDAIKYALKIAKKDDVVLIAGKGHETYQDIMGEKHHFDDREVARELFDSMKK